MLKIIAYCKPLLINQFEKLILKQIQKLEALNQTDITGKNQHGFKKKITATLGLQLQSLIARALDGGEDVLMASIDLS